MTTSAGQAGRRPVASVVVPAHDEASVLRRGLEALTSGGLALEVVVACNGCSDGTADVARAFVPPAGTRVTVLETEQASKNAALRLADALDLPFPRMYVDADVVVGGSAVARVAEALRDGPLLAARPPLRYDTRGADPLVAAFYRARERTPQLMSALWGAGFYGVSREGRARWGELADGVADDLFVDGLFTPEEKGVVGDDPVLVRTPRTTRALLRTLRRVYHVSGPGRPDATPVLAAAPVGASAQQLPRTDVVAPARRSAGTAAAVLAHNRGRLAHRADAGVYLGTAAAARLWRPRSSARTSVWERDDTTR